MTSPLSPQARSVVARLVEPVSLTPPQIVAITETPAPTAQEPRPGLMALTEIVAPNVAKRFDFDGDLNKLTISEQRQSLRLEGMLAPINALIRSFWSYAAAELEKGELPVLCDHVKPQMLLDNKLVNCRDVVNVPLNRKMLGCCRDASINWRSAFFEELAIRGFYPLTQNWGVQSRNRDEYREASGFLQLQDLSPEQVIWNGICSAIQFSCRSLTTLLQSGDDDDQSARLQLFRSPGLQQLHIDFIKKIARSWPPSALTAAIDIFSNDLTWSEGYNLNSYFPNIIRTSNRLIRTNPKGSLSPEYLIIRHSANEGSPNVPYLDFRAEKITVDQLQRLHSGRVVFGCPAGPILPQFLSWLFNAYEEFVLQPVDHQL